MKCLTQTSFSGLLIELFFLIELINASVFPLLAGTCFFFFKLIFKRIVYSVVSYFLEFL